jgi:hypothetical protein
MTIIVDLKGRLSPPVKLNAIDPFEQPYIHLNFLSHDLAA